jgi:hypothetical protein
MTLAALSTLTGPLVLMVGPRVVRHRCHCVVRLSWLTVGRPR